MLREAGTAVREFHTLTRGWACSMCLLPGGERQVLEVFLPGQIMGLRELGFETAQCSLVALTEIEACPFPWQRLVDLFEQSARLAELFFLLQGRLGAAGWKSAECSDRWSTTGQYEDDRHDQADHEQNPGDIRRGAGNAGQAECARDDGDDEKGQGP